MSKLYKVKFMVEYVYFEEAKSPKDAIQAARENQARGSVGRHGAWRQTKKTTVRLSR